MRITSCEYRIYTNKMERECTSMTEYQISRQKDRKTKHESLKYNTFFLILEEKILGCNIETKTNNLHLIKFFAHSYNAELTITVKTVTALTY